ncbi:MAG: hypothetical protein ACREEM_13540 [Blastocatellia bacterium]
MITISVSSETEEVLKAVAESNGLPIEAYIQSLLEKAAMEKANGSLALADDDRDPDSLNRAIAKMKSRTPEERAAMRERVMEGMPDPLPIPEGKTIFDLVPRIRGNETEAEVFVALERLS